MFDFDRTRFGAALVFHDPLDWALDCQLTVVSTMNSLHLTLTPNRSDTL